jgi:hypothetical protein
MSGMIHGAAPSLQLFRQGETVRRLIPPELSICGEWMEMGGHRARITTEEEIGAMAAAMERK